MDRLPLEVWVMIFEVVALMNATDPSPWNQKITMEMLLVSKQWYQAMRPYAYRTVYLTTKAQVDAFIGKIWHKAYLRPNVHHLRLEFPLAAPTTEPETPNAHRDFRRLVGTRVFQDARLLNHARGTWLSGLHLGLPWYWIAVLFPLLENLESLDITPGYLNRDIDFLFNVFSWLTEVNPQAFRYLTSFRVQTRSETSLTYHTAYLATLLPVGRLQKLSLGGLSFDLTRLTQRMLKHLTMALRPCSIRELNLHFHTGVWDHRGLVRTLGMFVNLESFAIQVDYAAFAIPFRRRKFPIDWAQTVREGLFASASTLKQLRLVYTGGKEYPNEEGENPHFFGSFAPFERLEFLQASLPNLFNKLPEAALEMPPNLQRLRITDLLPADVDPSSTTISKLVALRDSKLPLWKDLEVWRAESGWPENQCGRWMDHSCHKGCETCASCKMALSIRDKCVIGGISSSVSCAPGNGEPLYQSGW